MTEAVFQAPKRRPKVYGSFAAPLPASLSTEDGDHIILTAEIIGHHVTVANPAHIQHLYDRGFFGKGVFSRSRPEHVISRQCKYVGDRCLPVVSSSEYQKRLGWARAALAMQGLDDESVSRSLQILTKAVEFDPEGRLDSQAEGRDGSALDRRTEDVCCDQSDRRQGNPLYDPLAELYPQEPERRLKPDAKCRRHDDWIAHCGCRPDEDHIMGPDRTGADPAEEYEYVLVEESEDEENATKENVLIVQKNCISKSQCHKNELQFDMFDNVTEATVSSEEPEKDHPGKLVCRINPFPMMEYLQLSYEEAFFLVYALGCLSVHYSGDPLSVAQLWTMFRSLQPNFSISYAAYHYFRSKGWVPKSGIKYGTDLMLYRKGPPFYHASYSVVVDRVDESLRGFALRPFSWRSLSALNRTTGNVSKELMLCYVITPSDLTEDSLSSPECLRRFTVQEVLVSRWVSSRERTEQEEI